MAEVAVPSGVALERAVVRRSLREASLELSARRHALQRAVERSRSRAEDEDFRAVADAMMAYEAMLARARSLQDRLRQLSSTAEDKRRVGRARAGGSEPAGN